MKRTWMPRAAGILCIIAGVLMLVISVLLVALNFGEPSPMDGYGVILLFILPWSILLIIVGSIAIVGGIYALRRRRWGLALAGSICVLIFGIPLGVIGALFAPWLSSSSLALLAFVVFASLVLLPLIFVILGKREFK